MYLSILNQLIKTRIVLREPVASEVMKFDHCIITLLYVYRQTIQKWFSWITRTQFHLNPTPLREHPGDEYSQYSQLSMSIDSEGVR